LLMN